MEERALKKEVAASGASSPNRLGRSWRIFFGLGGGASGADLFAIYGS